MRKADVDRQLRNGKTTHGGSRKRNEEQQEVADLLASLRAGVQPVEENPSTLEAAQEQLDRLLRSAAPWRQIELAYAAEERLMERFGHSAVCHQLHHDGNSAMVEMDWEAIDEEIDFAMA